jgi:hypothetical protein
VERKDPTFHFNCLSNADVTHFVKFIFVFEFSILRLKKCLASPRVAALQHPYACDEWIHKSDRLSGKFTIYPLASQIV